MGQIDPGKERARLAARYAAMSDLELQKVGKDPSQLTEWGLRALLDEMKTRGLELKAEPREAKPIVEDEILTSLGAYSDRYQARIDRDALANVGIKAFFCTEDLNVTNEKVASAEKSGIRLLVQAKDLASARRLLKQWDEAERVLEEEPDRIGKTDRPVILRRYRDLPQAVVEKSVLEGAGIECFLQDDHVVRMDWLWSNAMGGIKLIVRETDAEEAEKLLKQPLEDSEGRSSGKT